MEYLMTYGWAILIIAVVLGALFQLGVFNSSSFSPRAPPGACQVFRPSGPGTTTNINLMGVCTGQLPQYVAQFNGASSYVNVQNNNLFFSNPNGVTVSAWVYLLTAYQDGYRSLVGFGACCSAGAYDMIMEGNPSNPNNVGFEVVTSGGTRYSKNPIIQTPINTWVNYIGVYDGNAGTVTLYINGVPRGQLTSVPSGVITGSLNSLQFSGSASGRFFPGFLTDIQIYNTSLTANQIQALYLEGIGGAPMKLQNLAGWWPLNGNSNDYSGNNNNGVPINTMFTSQYGK